MTRDGFASVVLGFDTDLGVSDIEWKSRMISYGLTMGIVVDDVIVSSGSVILECLHYSGDHAAKLADLASSGLCCLSLVLGGSATNVCATLRNSSASMGTTNTPREVACVGCATDASTEVGTGAASPNTSSDDEGATSGVVVGIVVAMAVLLCVVALLVVKIVKMKKNIKRRRSVAMAGEEGMAMDGSDAQSMVVNPRMFSGTGAAEAPAAFAETNFDLSETQGDRAMRSVFADYTRQNVSQMRHKLANDRTLDAKLRNRLAAKIKAAELKLKELGPMDEGAESHNAGEYAALNDSAEKSPAASRKAAPKVLPPLRVPSNVSARSLRLSPGEQNAAPTSPVGLHEHERSMRTPPHAIEEEPGVTNLRQEPSPEKPRWNSSTKTPDAKEARFPDAIPSSTAKKTSATSPRSRGGFVRTRMKPRRGSHSSMGSSDDESTDVLQPVKVFSQNILEQDTATLAGTPRSFRRGNSMLAVDATHHAWRESAWDDLVIEDRND